jgi:hypothetical protein
VRALAVMLALAPAMACQDGAAVRDHDSERLVAGTADTVLVHSERPVRLPIRVVDAAGRERPATGVQVAWVSGASVALSATGAAKCAHSGDSHVRASLGPMSTTFLLRCRPVRRIYMSNGPLQFAAPHPFPGVLSDSAQPVPLVALGPDGEIVSPIEAKVDIMDGSVASAAGLHILPIAPGGTAARVQVGDHTAGVSVKVYRRIPKLDALRDGYQYASLPITLGAGEMRRWTMPRGRWMFTMLPNDDRPRALQLRLEHAYCMKDGKLERRYSCSARDSASVVVYAPAPSGSRTVVTGELLVQRLDPVRTGLSPARGGTVAAR